MDAAPSLAVVQSGEFRRPSTLSAMDEHGSDATSALPGVARGAHHGRGVDQSSESVCRPRAISTGKQVSDVPPEFVGLVPSAPMASVRQQDVREADMEPDSADGHSLSTLGASASQGSCGGRPPALWGNGRSASAGNDTPQTLWEPMASLDGSESRSALTLPTAADRLWRFFARSRDNLSARRQQACEVLNGHWVHKKMTQVIKGGAIIGPDGSAAKMRLLSKDQLQMTLRGSTYTARLLGGALFWDDGDVWVREKGQSPFEGHWAHKKNLGALEVIAGEYLHAQDGSVVRLKQLGKDKIAVPLKQGTFCARLISDRLVWDDGDIWIRAQGRAPFDGRWTHRTQPGIIQLIKGETLHGPDGSEVPVMALGKSRMAIQLKGTTHRATLRSDELLWDDGDVWVRMQGRELFDGRWTQKKSHVSTEVIVGDTILRPDGSEVKITPQGENRFAMQCDGEVYSGQLVGDQLVWDDGDTWVRKEGSRAEVDTSFLTWQSYAASDQGSGDEDILLSGWERELHGLKTVLRKNKLVSISLICAPLGFFAFWFSWTPQSVFTWNILALLPMSWLIGKATKVGATLCSDAVGRSLNVHSGSALEVLTCLACIKQGQVIMVQYLLVGFMLSKLLLILGVALAWAGAFSSKLVFAHEGSRIQGSLLLLSVLSIMLPTAHGMLSPRSEVIADISRGFVFLLLSLYLQLLMFSSGNCVYMCASAQEDREDQEQDSCVDGRKRNEDIDKKREHLAEMSPTMAIIVLVGCLGLSFCCLQYLFWSIPGAVSSWRVSDGFIGVIVLPLVCVSTQQGPAIVAAGRSQVGQALSLTIGSACQTALLVTPLAVLAGWSVGMEVTLNFHPFQALALLLATLVTSNVLSGGESNWLEGTALVASYMVVATCYFFWLGVSIEAL